MVTAIGHERFKLLRGKKFSVICLALLAVVAIPTMCLFYYELIDLNVPSIWDESRGLVYVLPSFFIVVAAPLLALATKGMDHHFGRRYLRTMRLSGAILLIDIPITYIFCVLRKLEPMYGYNADQLLACVVSAVVCFLYVAIFRFLYQLVSSFVEYRWSRVLLYLAVFVGTAYVTVKSFMGLYFIFDWVGII